MDETRMLGLERFGYCIFAKKQKWKFLSVFENKCFTYSQCIAGTSNKIVTTQFR